MGSLIQRGAALLLALQLPAASAAEPAAPFAGGSAFEALSRCANERQQSSCQQAEEALQALIKQQESPEQQLQHPRCLGALSQVETVLAVFRWRLETHDNLLRVIQAAQQHCPQASADVGQ